MAARAASSSERPSHSKYHHGDLYQALAQEAYNRVRRDGADAVSLRAVAQAAGVSASAAYHHFPDKSALLDEVARRGSLVLDERCQAAVSARPGEDPAEVVRRLREIGATYIQFARDEPSLFRHIFGTHCDSPPQAEELDASGIFRALNKTLDALHCQGLLRFRPGLELLAWACVHGHACLLLDGLLPPTATEVLLDTFISVVLKNPPGEFEPRPFTWASDPDTPAR